MFLKLQFVENKALSGTISHFAVYSTGFDFESRSKAATASRWQQTGTIKRTEKDLKHELAFLSRAFSCSAYLQVTRALAFKI